MTNYTAKQVEVIAEWASHLADPVRFRFADPKPAKEWPGDTAAKYLRAFAALLRERESAQVPGLMYVPGMWRCAKCDFALLQSNLNAATGAVTPRDNPGDTCPNCATPMWRVTYRDAYADVMKLFEDHIVRERESALVVTDALRACAGALLAVCESGAASEKDIMIASDGERKTISDILDDADDALAAPEPPAVSDADVERANS